MVPISVNVRFCGVHDSQLGIGAHRRAEEVDFGDTAGVDDG